MEPSMKPNGVICAIDVNNYDQDVIDLAATFAGIFNVDLDLLHVSLYPDPKTAAWPAYLGSPNVIIQDNRRLKQINSNVKNAVVHRHHLSGMPWEKILEFVERNNPRLLILGTHGRRGLKRILGSVANKVMRHAKCPVMVLRQHQNSQTFDDAKTSIAGQT